MINYKIFTLQNGIDVLFLKRPEIYSVYVDILINAGSLYETIDESGVSHFFEHLLFDGSTKYPTEQLLRDRRQTIGLGVNASTNANNIHIQSSFPKKELHNSLSILREMVFESLMTDEAIQKERTIILDEQRQRRDGKRVQHWEYMVTCLFGKENPLSFSPGGTAEAVKHMTPDVIRKFYHKHVNSRNTSILIGGNFEFDDIEKELEDIFLPVVEGQKIPESTYNNSNIKTGLVETLEQPGNQEYFALTFPSYAGEDMDTNAQQVFTQALLNEELTKQLRIKKGLMYHISVSPMQLNKTLSLTAIHGSCNPDDFEEVYGLIWECIKNIQEKGFEKALLDRLRTTGNNTLPMRFDTLSGALSWCVNDFHNYRKVFLPDEIIRIRNKVVLEDLKRTMNEIFKSDQQSCIGLGPLPLDKMREIVSST